MVRTYAAAGAVGVLLAGATAAPGQSSMTSPPGPFATPGTAVGQSVVPVGQKFAPAGAPAGTPIGYNGPGGMPVTTTPPPGQVVDLTNLSAPLTAPLPPGLGPTAQKSTLQKLYDSWAAMIGISKPAQNLQTNWTPGISRRNRERHRLAWVRD